MPIGIGIAPPFTTGQGTEPPEPTEYVLLDQFLVDNEGSLPATRNADPGPGVLTKLNDVDDVATIESFTLRFNGMTDFGAEYQYDSLARVNGRALFFTFNVSELGVTYFYIGWRSSIGVMVSMVYIDESVFVISGSANSTKRTLPITNLTDYTIAIIMQTTGMYTLMKGDGNPWTLLWADEFFNTTPLLPTIHNQSSFSNDASMLISNVAVVDMSTPWSDADFYDMALVNDSTVTTGDTFTHAATGVIKCMFTLPGPNVANREDISISFRILNATNYWRVYLLRNGANTNWSLRVARVIDGVASVTTMGTYTSVGGIGAIFDGFIQSGVIKIPADSYWRNPGSVDFQFNENQTSGSITFPASTTVSKLEVWPGIITTELAESLDAVLP